MKKKCHMRWEHWYTIVLISVIWICRRPPVYNCLSMMYLWAVFSIFTKLKSLELEVQRQRHVMHHRQIRRWPSPKSFAAFFFQQHIIRHLCFHLHEEWAHSWVCGAAWDGRGGSRNAASSEGGYQTASSADLGDRGMLFWLADRIT